jgi:hypothetical protein
MEPEAYNETATNGVITKEYRYFSKESYENVIEIGDLKYEILSAPSFSTYKPVYNENAEKVRMISIKESNYFNILQSLAETFECWLDLTITRSKDGAISSK